MSDLLVIDVQHGIRQSRAILSAVIVPAWIFAAVTAFNEGEEWLDAALSTIESNAHYLKTILNSQIPAAKYEVPKCSYLAWVDVSNLNLGEDPSAVFLEKGRVAFNAGKIYGPNSSQFVRINLATSESVLAEAVNRMAKSL